jgi:hypothetical protein
MGVESRLSYWFIPLVGLTLIGSALIIFLEYLIVINNLSHLTDFDILTGLLFLTWIAAMPTSLILSQMRNYFTYADRLEVTYLFGLLKFNYNYKSLKISDYFWLAKGILIELPDGDQLTLGEKQYRNFSELKESLKSKIIHEQIEIKYSNRFARFMIAFGICSSILLIIALNFR